MDTYRITNNYELGYTLAKIRQDLGKTQNDIAPLVRSQRSYLSKLEHGWATEQLIKIFMLLREYDYEILLVPRGDQTEPVKSG